MYSSISPHESESQTFSFCSNDEMSFTSMPMFHPYFTTTAPLIPPGTTTTPKSTPNTQQQLNEPSRKRKQINEKKERNCKIVTAKGLRDRRVRLSIDIARQFFDLQDSLGFDTASKTLDWLLTKSRTAIKELQSTTTSFTAAAATATSAAGDVDSNKNNTTFCTKEKVVVQSSQLALTKEVRAKAMMPRETLTDSDPASFRLLQPIKSCKICESELFCFCLLNGITTQTNPQETFENFGIITKKMKPSTVISDNPEINSCNTFFCSNNFINSSGDLQEIFGGIQR